MKFVYPTAMQKKNTSGTTEALSEFMPLPPSLQVIVIFICCLNLTLRQDLSTAKAMASCKA